MAVVLTSCVGKGGENINLGDNIAVQILLNKFIIPGCLGSLKALIADGLIGGKTIAAIEKFQSCILGFKYPDGHVDPGGQTLAALNGPLKWAQKPATADDDDTTGDDTTGDDTTGDDSETNKSTLWGLLLLPGRTDTRWVFELLNVESKRAHRLVFTGAGKCNLEADLYIEETAKWVRGGHYIRFDLKTPADFEDFNRFAKITPAPELCGHALTISNLHKIPLPISHHTQWRGQIDGKIHGYLNEVYLYGLCKVEYGSGQPSRPLIWYR